MLFLKIPKGVMIDQPVVVDLLFNKTTLQQIFVLAEQGSNAELLITKSAGGKCEFYSECFRVITHENAHIKISHLFETDAPIPVVIDRKAKVHKEASINFLEMSVGTSYVKSAIIADLLEKDAEVKNTVLYLGRDEQKYDLYTASNHLSQQTHSNIITKGVLTDKAKGLSESLVKITKEAPHSNGFEQQDALVLSADAEADAIPMLEINNNEVKCSHGSTIGQVDKEKLFYLMSRGLSEKEAKKLARQYHCDHMYWSARDEDRYLFMIDLDMDVSIVYYFEYLD